MAPSWCYDRASEARSHTAPQAPTQSEASLNFTSFSCFSAASRRLGSIVPRRASTKKLGSMTKTLFAARILKFSGLSIPRHCAHGRTALRLPGAKGSGEMKYPDRTAPNLCNANIRRWHRCESYSMGDVVSGIGVATHTRARRVLCKAACALFCLKLQMITARLRQRHLVCGALQDAALITVWNNN